MQIAIALSCQLGNDELSSKLSLHLLRPVLSDEETKSDYQMVEHGSQPHRSGAIPYGQLPCLTHTTFSKKDLIKHRWKTSSRTNGALAAASEIYINISSSLLLSILVQPHVRNIFSLADAILEHSPFIFSQSFEEKKKKSALCYAHKTSLKEWESCACAIKSPPSRSKGDKIWLRPRRRREM